MPSFIKSRSDKKKWEKAKDRAREAAMKGGIYNVWGLTNHIYQSMYESITEDTTFDPTQVESTKGIINNIFEDECWNDIERYVVNHPVYSQLSEEEMWDTVEGSYTSYIKEHKDLSTGKIYEFVNSYANSIGGMNGLNVMGGGRDEAPIGPIVYGMPGNAMQPLGAADRKDPAIVVIPDKQSNYKPWETEIDAAGNALSDLERNKVISHDRLTTPVQVTPAKTEANDVDVNLQDLAYKLEDAGVDLESLEDMTEEEIEDLLLKVVKKDSKRTQNKETQDSISDLKEFKDKIFEAFTWELEEDRINGKTRKAREVLAKKHQMKVVLKRTNRQYLVPKNEIESLMKKYSYAYDEQSGTWGKATPKIKTNKPSSASNSGGNSNKENIPTVKNNFNSIKNKIFPSVTNGSEKETSEPNKAKTDTDPIDSEEDTLDKNPLSNPEIRKRMKNYQSRFILAIGHDDRNSLIFVKTETEEGVTYVPQIKDDEILSKITLLGYTWNSDKLLWMSENVTLPNSIFAKNENQKTIFARAYLASIGKINSIELNDSGMPSKTTEDVVEQIQNKNFVYDTENNKWNWVDETINESLSYETPSTNEEESGEPDESLEEDANNEDEEIQRGYKEYAVLILQGRFILRAHNILSYAKFMKKTNNKKQIDDFWDKVQNNDPTKFKRNLINPTIPDSQIIKTMEKIGYSQKDDMPVWDGKRFSELSNSGETSESILARAIITLENNNAEYIQFEDSVGKKGTLDTKFSSKNVTVIVTSKDHNYYWDKEYGWIKNNKKDMSQRNLSTDQKIYKRNAEKFLNRFQNTDWDYMSYKDRDLYKEYSAYPLAVKYLGIEEYEWPSDSEHKRNDLIRKFSQMYKFNVDTKDRTVKSWVKRGKPVMRSLDKKGFKAAVGKVARTVKGLGKKMFGLGSLGVMLAKFADTATGSPNDGRKATSISDVVNKTKSISNL